LNKPIRGLFLKSSYPDFVFLILVSTIFASVTLPLFPIWGTLIICASLAIVGNNHRDSLVLTCAIAVSVSLCLPFLGNWMAALINEPFLLAKNSLVFSNGLPLGQVETALLHLALATLTVVICYLNIRGGERWYYFLVLLASTFLAARTFSPLVTFSWPDATQAAAGNKVQQLLLLSAASPYFFRRLGTKNIFLNTIIGSAALIASITLLQHVVRDFSYVLTAVNLGDYFYRVRATYYYHAPSAQFLAICFPIVCSLAIYKKSSLTLYVITIVIFLALLLNGTRAVGLSIMVGFTLMAIASFLMRDWKHHAGWIFVAIACIFSTTVFYVKPHVGTINSDANGSSIISEMVSSNSNRISLASDIPSPNTRINPQNVDKPLEHPTALSENGPAASNTSEISSGYKSRLDHIPLGSSHILYLDLANNTGPVTLVLILLAFLIVVAKLYLDHFKLKNTKNEFLIDNGVAGALVVFTVSAFFFPFEKNWTTYLVVVLVGIIVKNTISSFEQNKTELLNLAQATRNLCTIISCGVVIFAFFWSPSFIFPAIEFTARYKNLLTDEKIAIFVTSESMKNIVSTSLALNGYKNSVLMLADDSSKLPQDGSFLIWDPANEFAYPKLRNELGIANRLAYRQWMSINLQPNWCIQNNFLPSIQFITVGLEIENNDEQVCGSEE